MADSRDRPSSSTDTTTADTTQGGSGAGTTRYEGCFARMSKRIQAHRENWLSYDTYSDQVQTKEKMNIFAQMTAGDTKPSQSITAECAIALLPTALYDAAVKIIERGGTEARPWIKIINKLIREEEGTASQILLCSVNNWTLDELVKEVDEVTPTLRSVLKYYAREQFYDTLIKEFDNEYETAAAVDELSYYPKDIKTFVTNVEIQMKLMRRGKGTNKGSTASVGDVQSASARPGIQPASLPSPSSAHSSTTLRPIYNEISSGVYQSASSTMRVTTPSASVLPPAQSTTPGPITLTQPAGSLVPRGSSTMKYNEVSLRTAREGSTAPVGDQKTVSGRVVEKKLPKFVLFGTDNKRVNAFKAALNQKYGSPSVAVGVCDNLTHINIDDHFREGPPDMAIVLLEKHPSVDKMEQSLDVLKEFCSLPAAAMMSAQRHKVPLMIYMASDVQLNALTEMVSTNSKKFISDLAEMYNSNHNTSITFVNAIELMHSLCDPSDLTSMGRQAAELRMWVQRGMQN